MRRAIHFQYSPEDKKTSFPVRKPASDQILPSQLPAFFFQNQKNTIHTAPPIMKSLSSSCCTHRTILFAPWASALRFVLGPATQ